MSTNETAILAGECFWDMQDLVRKLPDMVSTRVGYSGGDVVNATYRNHGTHAEALEVVFEPAKLSFRLSQGKLMRLGIAFLGLGALIILVPGLFGLVSAASLVGGAAVYFIGSGILYPTATSCAIEPFPGQAGTAGAILGGMQNLGAGLVTLLAASFPMEGQVTLGAIMVVMVLIVALSFLWLRHHGSPHEQMAV